MEVKKHKLLLLLQGSPAAEGAEGVGGTQGATAPGGTEKSAQGEGEGEEVDELVGTRCRAPLKEVSDVMMMSFLCNKGTLRSRGEVRVITML